MSASTAFEKHLLREELVTQEKLERALAEAEKNGVSLVEVIEQLGYATAEALYQSLARFCDMPYVVLSKEDIPAEVTDKIPARFASHYNFVPLSLQNGNVVVAVSDPLNSHLLDDIRLVLKKRVKAVVATPDEIGKAMKVLYGVGADTVERILSDTDSVGSIINIEATSAGIDLGDETIDASVIKFVNELLAEAIDSGATDIHIEPFEDELRVRYRIDGILHQVPTPSTIRGFHAAIVSRVKVMANLNIAEKRMPQDGKIIATIEDGKFDLRVSILPTPHGEAVNIRVLSRASMFMTLEDLGFLKADLKLFNGFLTRPHGIVLVTGPTGSGKTTTLYASLNKINDMERKTITIEDPIEYQLKGITQMQVLPQIGFDFSMGLRSMLRHDPDIMMVGEIRDYETAEMAIRSSLTGHLVFSTLHTNDAAGAVTRLMDMGVEPFLIASTMIASIAQRLVRRVCPSCSEPYQPTAEEFAELRVSPEELAAATFKKGSGCDRCRHTGYSGRVAIYEILPFSTEIKELTVQRATSAAIKNLGKKLGMRTLRDSGWLRVKSGLSTVDEIFRVTSDTDVIFE